MAQSRRRFIFTSGAVLSSSIIAVQAAEPSLPELSEQDPIAVALGYKTRAEDVDTKKFPKRAGSEGATQYCDNCTLYSETSDGLGTCTAIRGKLVAGKGWCNAWMLKS